MTHTDSRGVEYAVKEYINSNRSREYHKSSPPLVTHQLIRISPRPVDVKREARKGMSNAAKRAARKSLP